MIEFREVIERIKDIISHDLNGKVKDIDVANALGMNPRTLRVYKATNTHPFDAICLFAAKEKISLDWLLFKSSFTVEKLDKE